MLRNELERFLRAPCRVFRRLLIQRHGAACTDAPVALHREPLLDIPTFALDLFGFGSVNPVNLGQILRRPERAVLPSALREIVAPAPESSPTRLVAWFNSRALSPIGIAASSRSTSR
jgi:hypothetical protein